MVICQNCGQETGDAKFCSNCGSKIENNEQNQKSTKFCSNCGKEIDVNAVVCPHCGVQVQNASISQDINPTLAIILNVFLPGLGHIYAGLTQKGIIILVLAIIFVALIMVLVGGILYLILWVWALLDVNKCVKALNNGEYVEDKLF